MYKIQFAKDVNLLINLKKVYRIETVINDNHSDLGDCYYYELRITDYTGIETCINYISKKAMLEEFNALTELTHDYS